MKLKLHIGTHKTATTSIQHFCVFNRERLLDSGVFYPPTQSNAYNFNNFAADLAYGREEKFRAFLHGALNDARNNKSEICLLSAESFYAMSGSFFFMQSKPWDVQWPFAKEYWENEKTLIQRLKSSIPDDVEVEIIIYLRPQDDFANSLYNQLVKSTANLTLGFMDFCDTYNEVFDYACHLKLWADIFGSQAIQVNLFNDAKPDPVQHFAQTYLGQGIYDGAVKKEIVANERLVRDLFEFKRRHNAQAHHRRTYRYMVIKAIKELNEAQSDKGLGPQQFASVQERKAFFEQFSAGNDALQKDYNVDASLPVLSKHEDDTYEGLSDARYQELLKAFEALMVRPSVKSELFIKDSAVFLGKHAPFLKPVLNVIKTLRAQNRLKTQGW